MTLLLLRIECVVFVHKHPLSASALSCPLCAQCRLRVVSHAKLHLCMCVRIRNNASCRPRFFSVRIREKCECMHAFTRRASRHMILPQHDDVYGHRLSSNPNQTQRDQEIVLLVVSVARSRNLTENYEMSSSKSVPDRKARERCKTAKLEHMTSARSVASSRSTAVFCSSMLVLCVMDTFHELQMCMQIVRDCDSRGVYYLHSYCEKCSSDTQTTHHLLHGNPLVTCTNSHTHTHTSFVGTRCTYVYSRSLRKYLVHVDAYIMARNGRTCGWAICCARKCQTRNAVRLR